MGHVTVFVLIEMRNLLKWTFLIRNLWLKKFSVSGYIYIYKISLKNSKPVPAYSYPSWNPHQSILHFAAVVTAALCITERMHLLTLNWYCSWTTPLQQRVKAEPVPQTHGNCGTQLLTACLRSSHGKEGSNEQYKSSKGCNLGGK